MKEKIKSQGKGKDAKALDDEVQRKRREAAEKRAEAKRLEKERIAKENAEAKVCITYETEGLG